MLFRSKTTVLDIGITIEMTTLNKVTRTCANTIRNTTNGALISGIIASFYFFAQIINNIFVSNFFFFSCIRNPTNGIIVLSGALYSTNVKVVKTTVLDMGITFEITT